MEQEPMEREPMEREPMEQEPVEQETMEQEPMVQTDPVAFTVKLTAKDLWKFSLYHSNKGMLGIFNVIFSLAAIFLLVTTWGRRERRCRNCSGRACRRSGERRYKSQQGR